MSKKLLADHVMVFAETLSPAACDTLIDRFETSSDHELCQAETSYSFTQIDITRHWPDQHKQLASLFLNYFSHYQRAVQAWFWPPQFCFENLRIKRYLPNGRDSFPVHVDVMGQVAARRFMTAIIYLNAPDGGETVFPHLDLRVAPEPGKLVAFPPLWLFPHAGLPPETMPKYILHTYLCYPA